MRSEFGQRLFAARKLSKRTQVQVCKAVGLKQGSYAELESVGQGSSYTPKIAAYLGVNTEWLAYGEGEMLSSAVARHEPPSSELSPGAVHLGNWLDKIGNAERHARVAHACMSLILQELDGPHRQPTPEPDPLSRTPRVERQAR